MLFSHLENVDEAFKLRHFADTERNMVATVFKSIHERRHFFRNWFM
ncbi:hypothetical protein COCCU_10265 [Corynebacterium occultum]|uniref:Uncharacterized protein n=1 Tax=Corynebacterium occultum TaxID=2675219 RepID=A0A6B8VQZ6_9CORY|nr:hypothetical protein COCCU_10265 [Corynebacterium occultum]